MVGTISISFGGENREPDLTTPDAVRLHQELYQMYENGAKAAAIEVSSHGLAMGRVDAIDFDYAIFTNLTYDHLITTRPWKITLRRKRSCLSS